MKNDAHPLIMALKTRRKPVPSRLLKVQNEEIPGLAARRVGDSIALSLIGRVQAQDSDGHSMVHVEMVHPGGPDESQQKYPEPRVTGRDMQVRTQQSHA